MKTIPVFYRLIRHLPLGNLLPFSTDPNCTLPPDKKRPQECIKELFPLDNT
ncbi:hypothetical protein M23134_03916 [Microscilla marina ATCC 23134]|uniref:Uncharacterized protein n=1 Tax=Microscilla marina ATCC 23134 TaxID=313606 RepID=A1ZMI4_MICM2|nr:hypothetical protein M23134_03916 [Microscilla marina ATCC 23134]